jgi:hypothetical protein
MVTQFEERIALSAAHLFEIENILVKDHRLLNVIHLNRDMIASVDLHAHMSAYLKKARGAPRVFCRHIPLLGFQAARTSQVVILSEAKNLR